MASLSQEPSDLRALGSAVASSDHEELSEARLQELTEFTTSVASALETDSERRAAKGLVAFWTGHIGTLLDVDTEAIDAETRIENGHEAQVIGVDLYQALAKLETALDTDAEKPDLSGWADRLLELTNRHVAHLKTHRDGN